MDNSLIHKCINVIKCADDNIFAGVGGNIFLYKNCVFNEIYKIFTGQDIHGIDILNDVIVMHGGKSIAHGKLINKQIKIKSRFKVTDWIQALKILNDSEIIIVTAHNVAELWDLDFQIKLQSSHCEEKCILYCANIIATSRQDCVVLGGTVFSEVIVWAPFVAVNNDEPVLQRLAGHKGVIFSVAVEKNMKRISTTSDDRSVCIWSVTADTALRGREFWQQAVIEVEHSLFGHIARVWKSLVVNERILSVGEDSRLCVWNNAKLEQVLKLHQESGIRAVEYMEGSVVTGGEDGSVLKTRLDQPKEEVVVLDMTETDAAKHVVMLSKKAVVITQQGRVLTCDGELFTDKELATFCAVKSSPCDTYVAIVTLKSQLVILDIKGCVMLKENVSDECSLAVHWLPGVLVVCGVQGLVTLYSVIPMGLSVLKHVTLPPSKERWTTCACIVGKWLILGDRMGSLFVYSMDSKDIHPVQKFVRVHGHLGVSDLVLDTNKLLSCGRDGTVRLFSISEQLVQLQLTYTTPFSWAWKLVPWQGDVLVFGFLSNNFTVWSLKRQEVLAEHPCGGGHRSCAYRVHEHKLEFVFIKDKDVRRVVLALDRVQQVRRGFHSRTVNCVGLLPAGVLVSGSEDTRLRLSRWLDGDLETQYVLAAHMSSVRAVAVLQVSDTEHVVVTGGGRAQLSVWHYTTTLHFKHTVSNIFEETSTNDNPELRYMCLDAVTHGTYTWILAGCSDCYLQLLSFDTHINPINRVLYSHCILKVAFVQLSSAHLMAVSMATDGQIVLWTIPGLEKVAAYKVHQSGINSFDQWRLSSGQVVFATGGDDNMLALQVLQLPTETDKAPTILTSWTCSQSHSCQITGLKLLDGVMVSASIDQRITTWSWQVTNSGHSLLVGMQHQLMTDIADIQGLCVLSECPLQVMVYGKGIEVVGLPLSATTSTQVRNKDKKRIKIKQL